MSSDRKNSARDVRASPRVRRQPPSLRTGKAPVVLIVLLACAALAVVGYFVYRGAAGRPGGPKRQPPKRVPADRALADIQKILASHPNLADHIQGYREKLDKLAAVAGNFAQLQPTITRINRMRNRNIRVFGRSVNVWDQICKVSPSAGVMNSGMNALEQCVSRSQRILDIRGQLISSRDKFQQALEAARKQPTPQTVPTLCRAAGDLKGAVSQLDGEVAEVEGKVQSAHDQLTQARRGLCSVRKRVAGKIARDIAGLLDGPLRVTGNNLDRLRSLRAGFGDDAKALGSVAAYLEGKEIIAPSSQ